MADYTEQLIVGHYIHQRGENAHRTVGTCESVDIDYVVDLEVQRRAVHFLEVSGEFTLPAFRR